ncbi:MAG: hypothetical protein ACK40D_00315 [Cyanobacteriota bacterium]
MPALESQTVRQPQAVPLHLLACSLLVGAPASLQAPVMARAPKSSVAPSVSGVSPLADEEETFDEKLRQFGYWSGVALMCVQRITQLFGSDRAFFFAAAFGYGTSIQVDPARCKDALETFQQAPLLQRSVSQGQ